MSKKILKIASLFGVALLASAAPVSIDANHGVKVNGCEAPSCAPHIAWLCVHEGVDPIPDFCDPNDQGCI